MLRDIDAGRECITTPDASMRSGLSTTHLARLLRNGTLEGKKLGNDWLVYTDSLEKYLAKPRKPGPKGPIKKKAIRKDNSLSSSEDAGSKTL
ncbi:hypothetical protein KSD_62010 [Ktedonobacter sp. SOSP1-85]|nr:hypothetical protein KSD_62010 [Ktedonobacter sp. SOSP1-85]